MPKKYQDWRSWWDGLRASVMEAGATAVTTMLGTNGVANFHIPGLGGIGMNWKTFLAQFAIHIAIAAAGYIKAKPTADVVTEEVTITKTTTTTDNGNSETLTS